VGRRPPPAGTPTPAASARPVTTTDLTATPRHREIRRRLRRQRLATRPRPRRQRLWRLRPGGRSLLARHLSPALEPAGSSASPKPDPVCPRAGGEPGATLPGPQAAVPDATARGEGRCRVSGGRRPAAASLSRCRVKYHGVAHISPSGITAARDPTKVDAGGGGFWCSAYAVRGSFDGRNLSVRKPGCRHRSAVGDCDARQGALGSSRRQRYAFDF
jgi:hypothetical protein